MSEERYEQQDEKGEKPEKQDEKEEGSWDEKWRRDPLSAVAWALILIWAGIVLLAVNLKLFGAFSWGDAWQVFFLGAGLILLLEVVLRLLVPAYRQPVTGTIILAVIFLAIGLGGILRHRINIWPVVFAVVLIAVGAYALLSGLFRRRE